MNFLQPARFALVSVALATALMGSAWAGNTVQGKVLEIKNTDSYSYLRLMVGTQEIWAAVNLSNVKVGSTVTVDNAMEMRNFESKSLKKTFPSIVFGNLKEEGAGSAKPSAAAAPMAAAPVLDVKVAKAGGPNGRTVAEVMGGGMALSDKTVEIHAKVVKVNNGIMGKNWLHLRDGSGKADDGSNDMLVTTKADIAVGSTVTAVGTVRTNKDFGSGYSYKVMLEDASIKP